MDSYELYLAAMEHWQQGRLAEAIAAWQGSWRLNRQFKTALRLADAFEKAGDLDLRDAWIESAFAANPRHEEAATRFATTLVRRGDREEAVALLNRVLEKNPSYGPARQLRESLGGMS